MTLQSSEWLWAMMSALTVVLPIASALVVHLLLRRWGRTSMVCGKCEYAVRGLESPRCPECGSSFGDAGILPAGVTLRRQMAIVVAAVTLVWMIAFGPLFNAVAPHLPQSVEATAHAREASPQSGAYASVRIDVEARWRTGVLGLADKVTEAKWTAEFQHRNVRLEVDHVRKKASIAGPLIDEQHEGELTAVLLDEWLRCALEREESLLEEAEEILRIVRSSIDAGPPARGTVFMLVPARREVFRGGGGRGGRGAGPAGPDRAAVGLLIALYLAVWLYIVSGIVRAARRRLRREMEGMKPPETPRASLPTMT